MSDSESQVAPDAASQRRSAPQNEVCGAEPRLHRNSLRMREHKRNVLFHC